MNGLDVKFRIQDDTPDASTSSPLGEFVGPFPGEYYRMERVTKYSNGSGFSSNVVSTGLHQ